MRSAFIAAALVACASAQQVGNQKSEFHPQLPLTTCTTSGGCQTEQKSATMDSNWRWIHNVGGYTNCYEGTEWDRSFCPDGETCAKNCAIDGVDNNDMRGTYGVTAQDSGLRLNFVTQGQYSKNVGSRLYMMADDDNYEMFKLRGQEFSVEVDVSQLPCGVNGALYFVEMSENGDKGVGNNEAGAKYGTGYCDAQCPHDMKFIKGKANIDDWNDKTAMGKEGICCQEMDIWEANQHSSAYTLHPCNIDEGSKVCDSDITCGDGDHRYDGVCDKDGCDLNPYRAGVTDFFGPGKTVDTNEPFTVVTQFITEDGSTNSDVVEVKRLYIQYGKKIPHPETNIEGLTKQYDSISDTMCTNVKSAFGDQNDYANKGGIKKQSDALGRGMVLVMSLWDDHAEQMRWLDSTDPVGSTHIGAQRGTCSTDSGQPDQVESEYPNAYVIYKNIKVGDIDSTYQEAMEYLQ